jgi:phospholipid/cholesterol/gamma-HCH transport system permease protein
VHTAGAFYDQLQQLRKRADTARVVLDFAELGQLDSAGIAVISLATAQFAEEQRVIEARHLKQSHRRALEMMPTRLTAARPEGADEGFFERAGQAALDLWQEFAELVELLYDTLRMASLTVRRKRKLPLEATLEQAVLIGVDAVLIVSLLSFLLGLIMAFQSAWQLRQFGANIYVANLVGISMVREFGPIMTGIMLAGRSGSAIAAELGTMKVSEEIDALKTMGIDPVRFLVLAARVDPDRRLRRDPWRVHHRGAVARPFDERLLRADHRSSDDG